MPFLIFAAGAVLAIYFFIIRARNAAGVATELVEMASDVRLAARRFGFIRKSNQHAVDGIEDARLAMAGLAVSFLELDDYPTQEQRDALLRALQTEFGISKDDATEMMVLGRWLMNECGGVSPAVSRLSRKLCKMDGAAAITPVMALVQAGVGEAGLGKAQLDALEDVKRAFRIM